MKRKTTKKPAPQNESMVIRPENGKALSRTQVEFNRLMKSLENTKARHTKEQARLDEVLATSIRELMPMIEDLNRVNRDLILKGRKALHALKLTAKRRHWFSDLLSGKATDLLADPVGLSEADIEELEAVVEELGPSEMDQQMKQDDEDEFDFLRTMLERAARDEGVELDLSDLELNGDPGEFERALRERLGSAAEILEEKAKLHGAGTKAGRKPTKAQAERERKRQEIEEAKNRDLKSLFKQLAKAFHPDLEPDPLLKEHKKGWMQRLNTAYAVSDLREMLQLEMEWLGEEASNLATAGDEKLKVYCMVLKEQIADLKRQTHDLSYQPQYSPLHRFRDPYFGTIANPLAVKRDLQNHLRHHREMVRILDANNASSRRIIYEWVDEHMEQSSFPF